MDRKKKLYKDILDAIILIQEFTSGLSSYQQYVSDTKTKSAVERQLSIIGEALNQLRKIDQYELKNTNKIIGLRNLIIHAYDSIDDTIIWSIVQQHLSPLKEEVSELLIND